MSIDSDALVEWLMTPSAYADGTTRVERLETHISWIFLTNRFAYKLKKPVRFDFLDFHTPQMRRAACEAEVRLNRRLGGDTYLGVVPITQSDAGLAIDGEGTPIDWLVKMKRLPADRSLDRLIAEERLKPHDIEPLAKTLSRFYAAQPPLEIAPAEYRRHFEEHVRSNLHDLANSDVSLDQGAIRRIHQAQLRLLLHHPHLFDERVESGRIVEGHGDLRPEHAFLLAEPVVIDCIEFNADYRRIDLWDELCFFAVECETLGAGWIGEFLLEAYQGASDDNPPDSLSHFYRSYRACVRAKVNAIQAGAAPEDVQRSLLAGAQARLEIADKAARQLSRPQLIIIRGLTGSGKTTLAERLAATYAVDHLQTDAIRRELFGASDERAGYGQAIYRPENREFVYDQLFSAAAERLQQGHSTIIDGTFLTAAQRSRAVELAEQHNATPALLVCECPEEIAKVRIVRRAQEGNSLSESHLDILAAQQQREEPDPEGVESHKIDAAADLDQQVAAAINTLRIHH
ncbi:AAA family ATPase [Blastopirellula sp. JC732]|uniref:AAA family ATPase n=1 Tax=Blastopirellula sediminis TaxID=2894196 RepID=A0A9X1MLF3_9BACT|nr:bifunctional aminoglycoside phosphotransferase/ATP-binding protein [Blastopirellula sediminis]MCC9608736.1 AAA family ATPase [Blastopirellula sediminis]MCC9628487.1 AAA family ATPase [Blastopirellula sediminis]